MKKILNSGLALILLAIGSISASADILYINDINGGFGTFNTTTDKVTFLGTSGIALSDIGFTSNGQLYGSTHTDLYSVNITNGATTLLDSFNGAGASNIVGLVGNGPNLIANSYITSQLYAIDVSPYSITALTGSTGVGGRGDLAFGVNGALYDTLNNGDLARVTISGNNITSTIVGNSGLQISGLATGSNGVTYALAGTEIYTINLTDGALTNFYNYAGSGLGNDSGAAIFSSGLVVVPEPGSIALLFAGLAGLVFYQRRRAASTANIG